VNTRQWSKRQETHVIAHLAMMYLELREQAKDAGELCDHVKASPTLQRECTDLIELLNRQADELELFVRGLVQPLDGDDSARVVWAQTMWHVRLGRVARDLVQDVHNAHCEHVHDVTGWARIPCAACGKNPVDAPRAVCASCRADYEQSGQEND